jgi:hypothetical protein
MIPVWARVLELLEKPEEYTSYAAQIATNAMFKRLAIIHSFESLILNFNH